MDTNATQEKPAETAANQQKLCKPLDEQETLLLDEVAQEYFKKASEDMRGRVGLSPMPRTSGSSRTFLVKSRCRRTSRSIWKCSSN